MIRNRDVSIFYDYIKALDPLPCMRQTRVHGFVRLGFGAQFSHPAVFSPDALSSTDQAVSLLIDDAIVLSRWATRAVP